MNLPCSYEAGWFRDNVVMARLVLPDGEVKLFSGPELIDAMPLGMGSMMRFMGKIPVALDLMKPIFPILFPRLLPLMMLDRNLMSSEET